MMRRLIISSCGIGLIAGFLATPTASAQQVINLYVGGFIPHGLDNRGTDDVLFKNFQNLDFDIRDFRGATAGAEYLVGLGDFFDAGLGVGIYSRSSLAADHDFQFPNGNLILADLKLRIIPVTATFRYLPLGHHDAIMPYIGGGVGIYNFRYTESGDFADSKANIFSGTFVGSGTAVGPVILGGVRIPVGHKGSGFGGEIRYQGGNGNLSTDPVTGFLAPKIDLGGFNYLFTISVGF